MYNVRGGFFGWVTLWYQIRKTIQHNVSASRYLLSILTRVLQSSAGIWGFNFWDRVACVKIGAPPGFKVLHDVYINESKSSHPVMQGEAFFSRRADDFGASLFGLIRHRLLAGFALSVWGIWRVGNASYLYLRDDLPKRKSWKSMELYANPPPKKIFYMIMYCIT